MIDSLMDIITTSGGFAGIASAFVMVIKSISDKKNSDTDNLKKMLDEAQEERVNIRQQHLDYMNQTDKKIDDLEKKIEYMEKRNTIKMRAINSAYRCTLPEKTEDCPVLMTLNKECVDDGKCSQS